MPGYYEGDYYVWLLESIGVVHGEYENYKLLVHYLFASEFKYILEMDENRAMAGLNLRSLFSQESGVYLEDVYTGPCTVLEMLIALANDIAFDTSTQVKEWFWEMADNLGLLYFDDQHFDKEEVRCILNIWMERQYDSCGHGSIFPVESFDGDMRSLEIWSQKNAYMTRLYPVNNEWEE